MPKKPSKPSPTSKKLILAGSPKPKPKPKSKLKTGTIPQPPAVAVPAQSGAAVLDRLWAVILERRTADPAVSHSARLLSRGVDKVAQKFGEEAVECLIEAVAGHADLLVPESADVLYHLLVLWVASGVEPADVWAELARREGISGVAEKAARMPSQPGMATRKIP